MGNRVPRVYVDANVYILAYETLGSAGQLASAVLEAADQGAIHIVTSELTLAEVLPKPIERGQDDLAAAYRTMLTDGASVTMLPVSREIPAESATIRAGKPSVKLQDAIHCASAIAGSCEFLISDDTRIPKHLTFEFARLAPGVVETITGQTS